MLNKVTDTDFILEPGADSHAWNVIRSESDELMFRHAGKCGARTFDGVKVTEINFVPTKKCGSQADGDIIDPGRPVSASWVAKDGRSGTIKFDYLVDASGRAGIVSTRYMKNRTFNKDLKNVASWGYWRGAISYGIGTMKEGQPLFEALTGNILAEHDFYASRKEKANVNELQTAAAGSGSSLCTMGLSLSV